MTEAFRPYNLVAWKRLREAHLAIEPQCRACAAMGRLTRADTVDHVHAISEGGPAFPGHDGLASYCGPCHSAKTARGAEAGAVQSSKPRRGCDANGNPLDPAHPWNAGKSLRADVRTPPPPAKIELVQETPEKGER